MSGCGLQVEPQYSHSGLVFATALAYLDEHGVSLPSASKEFDGLVACASGKDAATLHDSLESIMPKDDELCLYFEAFNEEEWNEAGLAMQKAFIFLKHGLTQAAQSDKWLLIFIE